MITKVIKNLLPKLFCCGEDETFAGSTADLPLRCIGEDMFALLGVLMDLTSIVSALLSGSRNRFC